MKVVIIGSGNVATIIGRKISNAGHHILQVVSRSFNNAQSLASQLNATPSDDIKATNTAADLYLLCVADSVIYDVAQSLPFHDKLIVHTAGGVSKNVLSTHLMHGVLYPLQSLRKEMSVIPDIPVLVDGSSPEITQKLFDFSFDWASSVSICNDEERLKLHVAAVFASNFTNHIYTLVEEFCKKESINFPQLLPLIKETAIRLKQSSPSALQTGPAKRNDTVTMQKHLEILRSYPELKELYTFFSRSITTHYPVVK